MLAALVAAALLCSPAGAKSAHAQTGVGIEGAPDRLLCFDLTRDGRRDLALTVASGGTAGDVAWLVLVGTPTGSRVALARGGYKLLLVRRGRDLVETDPVYRNNDPNCCPTGGFDHTRWRWNGHRFAVVRSWHDRSYRVA